MRRLTRGFALPMVILVMFILVGAIAAGFAMLSNERGADDAVIQSQMAVALAETGLQQGLRNRVGLGLPVLPPIAGDQDTVDLGDAGYAILTTRVVRDTSLARGVAGLYFVQSRGVTRQATAPGVGGAVAVVGSFATMEMMQTTFTAALTSLNGISLGSSGGGSENGTIDGSNTAGCGGGAVAAISAPTGGVLTGKAFRESSLIGSPKISYQGSTAEAVSNSRIAWAEIVRPDGRPSAGFTVRGNFSNPSPWPASDGRWHIIRVLNDGQQVLKLPNGVGRGMLIVAGDLEIKGATTWEGIILAGGRLTFAGGARSLITGAVVTGLNYETRALNALPRGDFQLDDSNLSGAVDITYSSCAISRAVAAAGTLRPVSRTWVNTLPSY